MGIRRTRANSGTSPTRAPSAVETRKMDWTVPEARELFRKGYSAAQVERLTKIPERAFNPAARRGMARRLSS